MMKQKTRFISISGAAIFMSLFFSSFAHAKAKVAVLTMASQETFQSKHKVLFAEACSDCALEPISIEKVEGQPVETAMAVAVDKLPSDFGILYVDFNFKMADRWKPLVEALNKKADAGVLLVGTAGLAPATEASVQVSRTFLGQAKKMILIGELTERERLLPASYYGPELLTAVKPPKEWMGQGYAPLLFVGRLAAQNQKRNRDEWLGFLDSKKAKSKKLWVLLEDFFPR